MTTLDASAYSVAEAVAISTGTDARTRNSALASVDAEISAIDASVAALDEELNKLQARKSELQERKTELLQKRKVLSASVAPITRLVPELLARVFEFAVEAEPESYALDDSKSALERLNRVSKGWREVALATPSLYRDLYLHLEKWGETERVDGQGCMRAVRRAQAFLERSGGCRYKLYLKISSQWWKGTASAGEPSSTETGETPPAKTRNELLKEILDKLKLSMKRLSELSLEISNEEDMDTTSNHFRSLVKDSEAVVEVAKLSLVGTASFRHIDIVPGVRRLCIRSTELSTTSPFTTPIPRTVNSLELTKVTSIPFHPWLRWLDGAAIEQLKLVDSSFARLTVGHAPITLDSLVYLKLYFNDDRNGQAVIEAIHAPALQTVAFKGGYVPRIDPDQTTYRATSSPLMYLSNVTTLHMIDYELSWLEMRDFFTLLKAFQSLRSLKFMQMTLELELFAVWAVVAHHKVCPKLEIISFSDKCSFTATSSDGQRNLVSFLESKANAGAPVVPLKELHLHGTMLESDIIHRIRNLGINVLE